MLEADAGLFAEGAFLETEEEGGWVFDGVAALVVVVRVVDWHGVLKVGVSRAFGEVG